MDDITKLFAAQAICAAIVVQQIIASNMYSDPPQLTTNEGITHSMDTRHTISFSDGATVYAADFRNKQVIAGQVKEKTLSGGGYGSLKTFGEFNKKAIDEARDTGCFIAKQVIETPENPWYTYSLGNLIGNSFEERKETARAFKNAYCVPKNG